MNFIKYFKEGFVVGYVVSVGFVTASLMSCYYLIWLDLKQRRRNKANVSPFRNTIVFLTNKPHSHDQVCKFSPQVLSSTLTHTHRAKFFVIYILYVVFGKRERR